MKRILVLGLILISFAVPALAQDSGSWGQINQSVCRAEGWQRYGEDGLFVLGEATPLEGTDISILDWGTYPSIDGSTVCVPMAMELARQLLNMPEEDLNGFVNLSTTHYAYLRLFAGEGNPSVTVLSRNAMMDPDHPVDLFLGTAPSDEEYAQAAEANCDLELVPVCYDAFVFLVNAENDLDGLTAEQIRQIYSGKITSWAELGSELDVPVRAFQRPANSGSQTAMENLVMKGEDLVAEENYISDGMADLVEQIGSYNNGWDAIGYSYLFYVNELYKAGNLKVLAVDGVEPTPAHLADGSYPYTVCYYAVFRKGDANTAAFVDWMLSDAGQKSIAQAGYVPLRSAE